MTIMARWRRRRRKGPVAFVLSGGGNLGALQIGMLRALAEREVTPDVVIGCSVGAINGAGLAEDPTAGGIGRLERLWRELDGKELMPGGILPPAVALARRGEAIHGSEGLRRELERQVTARTFEELTVPFQCVATDVMAVREVWFDSGPLIDPIMASAALPAVYPAVEIDGVRYLDGAIVDDVPISRAVEVGAGTIYVLQVSGFARPRPEPRRPLDVAIQSYWIARHHRFKRELESVPSDVDVHLLPTGDTPSMRYNDFSRSSELMSLAYEASADYLAGRPAHPAVPIGTEAPVDTAEHDDGAVDEDADAGAPDGVAAGVPTNGRPGAAAPASEASKR